jgi:hypothetical protein
LGTNEPHVKKERQRRLHAHGQDNTKQEEPLVPLSTQWVGGTLSRYFLNNGFKYSLNDRLSVGAALRMNHLDKPPRSQKGLSKQEYEFHC